MLLRAFLGVLADVAQQVPDDGFLLSERFDLALAEVVRRDQVDDKADHAQAHKALHGKPKRQARAQRVRAWQCVHDSRSSIT